LGTPERGSSSTYRKWDCPGRDPGIILFLPAILFVTYFAGLGPGILTALLSGITLWYVFLPPYYSFAFSPDDAPSVWPPLRLAASRVFTLVHLLRIAIARAQSRKKNRHR